MTDMGKKSLIINRAIINQGVVFMSSENVPGIYSAEEESRLKDRSSYIDIIFEHIPEGLAVVEAERQKVVLAS